MPRRVAAIAVLATAFATGGAAQAAPAATATAAAKRCGTVDLVIRDDPYTKARGITASGTSCRKARRVAKGAQRVPFPTRYRARGFTCKGVEEYGAVYAVHYTCRRDAARIRFRMSAS